MNAQDAFGITPLLAAVYEGHTEAVQVLVKAKADVNAKGPDGMSALEAAEKDEVKAILKSAGGTLPLLPSIGPPPNQQPRLTLFLGHITAK